jgi:hypothetical protein
MLEGLHKPTRCAYASIRPPSAERLPLNFNSNNPLYADYNFVLINFTVTCALTGSLGMYTSRITPIALNQWFLK